MRLGSRLGRGLRCRASEPGPSRLARDKPRRLTGQSEARIELALSAGKVVSELAGARGALRRGREASQRLLQRSELRGGVGKHCIFLA
jgi:hypothetical protein